MVYYLKYRPQTIDDLDNDEVRETLTNVLSSENPPHAYLFTGPRGLGKTSSARIVAKVLNCERLGEKATKKKEKLEPCNTCDMCISITKGTNMDVIEIDAASNRGIDEMRDLREKIRLSPVSARRKVYIIDEVHMLTTEAFNALLKTLEEPPAHAVFILATTEPQKIPATILSRCLHVQFHKATETELLRSFSRIVKGEKLDIDDAALLQIARLSDGGFRDGTKVLEELVLASGGKKITSELIEEKYHTVSGEAQGAELLSRIAKKDLKGSILLLEDLAKNGSDMKLFLERLLEQIHELVLSVVSQKKETSLFSLADLQRLVFVFQKAYGELRVAVIPQLPLELAVLTYFETPVAASVKPAASTPKQSHAPQSTNSEEDDQSINAFRKQVGELHKQRAIHGEEKEEKKTRTVTNGASLMSYNATGDLSKEWLAEFWQSFIIKMKDFNHTISGVLRGCHMRSFDRQKMVIETAYVFHKDKLSESKTLTALTDAATALAGNPVTVTIELKSNN